MYYLTAIVNKTIVTVEKEEKKKRRTGKGSQKIPGWMSLGLVITILRIDTFLDRPLNSDYVSSDWSRPCLRNEVWGPASMGPSRL